VVEGALADERQGEVVDVGAVRGPVRLRVRDDAELAEARLVVGMHELNVREMVARVALPVRLLRHLDRVEGFAHGSVSDRVQVHLKTVGVEEDEHAAELFGLVHGHPAVVRPLVGLEERPREVLEHPVLEDLHAADAEPAERPALPQFEQVVDLLLAA
jgi:hypothetical protein